MIEKPWNKPTAYCASRWCPDLLPTEESIVNVLKTLAYEDPAFAAMPPFKYFDLSLLQEITREQSQIQIAAPHPDQHEARKNTPAIVGQII